MRVRIRVWGKLMSFLSILKTVGTDLLGVSKTVVADVENNAPAISAALSALNPAAGAIFNTVTSSITAAEQYFSTPKSGAQKLTYVLGDFSQGLAIAQQVLALNGSTLNYNSTALTNFVNAQVAAMNALATLQGSFNITSTTPAAAPVAPAPTPVVTPAVTPAAAATTLPLPTTFAPSLTQASTFVDPVSAKIIGL